MQSRIALTSVVVALAATITTLSFAQHRDAAAAATDMQVRPPHGVFTQYDSIPWKALSTKQPGLQMYVVWGNPEEGSAEIVQKFPAGWDSGWHWHSAAYEGVVVQGRWTHTFKGAAPETGGPGSTYSQPARQIHDDRCEEGTVCIIVAHFHGKRDFIPVDIKAWQ